MASPSQPPEQFLPTGLPSPPPSPRKRRRWLRDSDDSAGEMAIESYIYRSEPYRSSTASLPLPLPLREVVSRENLDLEDPGSAELLTQMEQVVLDHELDGQHTFRVLHLLKPGYPNGDGSVETLRLDIFESSGLTRSWSDVRNELQDLLRSHGFPHMEVEILDRERALMPSIFFISPGAASIQVYEETRADLIALLFDTLKDAWNAISVFEFGQTKENARPSVVVFVEPFASSDWQTLELTMKAILWPKLPQGFELAVEFIPSGITDLTGVSCVRTLSPHPVMGSSLGVVGQESSGTIGGFVELSVGGKTYQGILTNHHVVEPPEGKAFRKGFGFDGSGKGRPVAQYPSGEDHRETKTTIQEMLSRAVKTADFLKENLEMRVACGEDISPQLKFREQQAAANLRHWEKQAALIDELPIVLGEVLVTSGRLINAKKAIVDWAFIRMPSDKFPKCFNNLPPRNTQTLDQMPELSHPPIASDEGPVEAEGGYAQYFSSIVKGNRYFKLGRTTGITVGVCHGVETDINRERHGVFFDESGDEITLTKGCTRELVILAEAPRYIDHQTTFSASGDSGSILFDHDGFAAGLLYGELTGHFGPRSCAGAGLVTCMTDVLASIESKSAVPDEEGNMKLGTLTLKTPGS